MLMDLVLTINTNNSQAIELHDYFGVTLVEGLHT